MTGSFAIISRWRSTASGPAAQAWWYCPAGPVRRWWVPPLWASFAASLVFSAVYYPAAFAGEIAWAQWALVHFALFFGESVLLLAPYALLRPAMRPLHGMNGY